MPTTVEIPELGDVEFPDSMSMDEIDAACGHLYDHEVRLPKLRQRFAPSFDTSESDLATLEAHEEQERLADAFQKPGFLGQLWHDVLTRPVADFTKAATIGKTIQMMAGRRGVVMGEDDWPMWQSAMSVRVNDLVFPGGLTPGTFERHESFTDPLNPNRPAVQRKLRDYYDMYIKDTPRQTIAMSDKEMMDMLNGIPSAPELQPLVPGSGPLAAVGGAVEGVENFVLSTIGFLSSPVGLLTLGTVPALAAASKAGNRGASAAQAGLSLGFAALMGKELPAQWQQMREAIKEGDTPKATRVGTEGFLTLLATGAAGVHGLVEGYKAVKGKTEPPPFTPQSETRLERLLPEQATQRREPIITPPPLGRPTMTQVEMAMRDAAILERQTVPEPEKRPTQVGEVPIIGERPVTIEHQLILPQRFMEAEAKRDSLVSERDRLSNAFSVAARNGDLRAMSDSARAIEEINVQLNENRNVRESLSVDLEGDLEGTYPPTAEQLGTFQSRAVVPELSETTKIPTPEQLPAANQPESTRLSPRRPAQPVEGQVYPEPPVGVVPSETLRAEQPLPSGEFPPARPPKSGGVPESEQTSGIITGTDLERWADRVIAEDPRSKSRLSIDVLDVRRLTAIAVKGAGMLERGIRDFESWSSDMIKEFGDAIVPHIETLWKRSSNYLERRAVALAKERISGQHQRTPIRVRDAQGNERSGEFIGYDIESRPSVVWKSGGRESLGIIPEGAEVIGGTVPPFEEWQRHQSGEAPSPGIRPLGEIYSEPMLERLRRLGGPTASVVAQDALKITDKAKRLMGQISRTHLDEAKKAAGKAFRGGTSWIQGLRKVTPSAAISRFHSVIEEHISSGNWNHLPEKVRPLAQTLWDANLAIGRLAQRANPDFVASGKVQRILTPFGIDLIKRGRGSSFEALVEGTAAANHTSVAAVRTFLSRWKSELDKPEFDAAGLDKIAQDFTRDFPKAITHVKSPTGAWHEVLISSPFQYLEQAGQRTANAVAFRETYPIPGTVEKLRASVQTELPTDTERKSFDNLLKALQGHPADVMQSGLTAPDTVPGATARAIGTALRPVKSALLTQSLATNIGETFSGGAHIFFGYDRAFKALAQQRRLKSQLTYSGAVNKALRDLSFNPSQPLQSLSRFASNFISKGFLNDLANEIQERTGATAAKLIVDEVHAGTISAGDRVLLANTMRAAGFTKEQAVAASEGRRPEVLNQFETKAAEFLSSGNQALAEKSRLGASKAFNQLFWFHSYPMLKVRQARSILNNIIEDANTKDWKGAYENSKLLGRFLGGTALAGAITTGVLVMVREGLYGTGIRKQEAQDEFGRFVLESYLQGMGGPLQAWSKIAEESGSAEQVVDSLKDSAFKASAPANIMLDAAFALSGSAQYKDADFVERIEKFIASKTPGLKPFKLGAAAFGLSEDDPKLDAAIAAYYRWSRREIGSDLTEIRRFNDDRAEVRKWAKLVVGNIRDGKDFADPLVKSIQAAAGTKTDNPYDSAARSIRGKMIIGTGTGDGKIGKLSAEEMAALRKHIGDEPVNRIMAYDALLDAVADYVVGMNK